MITIAKFYHIGGKYSNKQYFVQLLFQMGQSGSDKGNFLTQLNKFLLAIIFHWKNGCDPIEFTSPNKFGLNWSKWF